MRRLGTHLFAVAVGSTLTAIVVWEKIREHRIAATKEVLDTYRERQRLTAHIRTLEDRLDAAHADTQTQAAFLREGYRSKTGEIL